MVKLIQSIILIIFSMILQTVSEDHYYARYNGYKLLKVRSSDSIQLEYLRRLQRDESEVDFWTDVSDSEPVTFMVSPDNYHRIQRDLQSLTIPYTVTVNNVQEILKATKKTSKRKLEEFDLDDFNSFEDIYRWMNKTADDCPQRFHCKVYKIGRTYEGQDIPVFKIWKREPGRKAVWIDATIHAREWLSTATAIKILHHIVTSSDESAELLRENYDWYFAPVLNPDGYVYSHNEDRLWRKNRSPNQYSDCKGTDLNRNFDYHWGSDGISRNPCSPVYCGSNPASELEARAIQRVLKRIGRSLAAMVSLHTYGNMWMFPYGFIGEGTEACVRSALHENMMEVAESSSNAVQSVYNTKWKRGTSCEVVYTTSGTSTDFALGVLNISYPFCLELRGENFIVPPEEIDKSYREVWSGIEAMLGKITELQKNL